VRGNLNDSVHGFNRHRETNGDSGQVMPTGGWPIKTHFWTVVLTRKSASLSHIHSRAFNFQNIVESAKSEKDTIRLLVCI
jgi:hypothetical protein